MEELIYAYLNTSYHVYKLNTVIHINVLNNIIDSYLEIKNKISYAFITAWNPQSTTLTDGENKFLNEKLKTDLSKFEILDGEGKGEEGNWPLEASFFVAGISLVEATALAKKYNQKAFVYGEIYQPSQLIICN